MSDQILWVTKEFDWNFVLSSTGYGHSVGEMLEWVHGFDLFVENNSLAGYIDASDILSDALMNSLPSNYAYSEHFVDPSTVCDYFAYIWDSLSSNMEDDDDYDPEDDDVQQNVSVVADRAHRLLSIFILGLTIHLSDEEREYLSDNFFRRDDISFTNYNPYDNPYIAINESIIVFPIAIIEDIDNVSGPEREVRSFYFNGANRRVSNSSSRASRNGKRIRHNNNHIIERNTREKISRIIRGNSR